MKIFILIGMLNIISLFRFLNIDNMDWKYGKGTFYRIIGPIGSLLGSWLSRYEAKETVSYIIGLIFNVLLIVAYLILV